MHYHVKDSVDRPSKRKPFTYVEPGTGEFPWPALGELLRERKPNAQISFEWEQHWNPELADIEDVMWWDTIKVVKLPPMISRVSECK